MNINIYYFQTLFHVQWEYMEKKGGKKISFLTSKASRKVRGKGGQLRHSISEELNAFRMFFRTL